jgi:hypothetical protein
MPVNMDAVLLIAVGPLLLGVPPLYPYSGSLEDAPLVFLALGFLVVAVLLFL